MRFLIICFCLMFLYGINAEDENDSQNEKGEKIRSIVAQLKSRVKRSRDHNGFLFKLVELLLDVMKLVRADNKKLKLAKGPAGIGFTAIAVGGHVNVKQGSPIPFSKIINDYGYGFGIENSYFVCKKEGLYQFSASVCIKNKKVWVRVYNNDKEIGYLYKDNNPYYGCASGSTVVRMVRGDKLHLAPNKDILIYGKITIISGFRISS